MNKYPASLFEEFLRLNGNSIAQKQLLISFGIVFSESFNGITETENSPQYLEFLRQLTDYNTALSSNSPTVSPTPLTGNVLVPGISVQPSVCPPGQEKDNNGRCIPVCPVGKVAQPNSKGEIVCVDPSQIVPDSATCPEGYGGFFVLNLGNKTPLCCPKYSTLGPQIEPDPTNPKYFRCKVDATGGFYPTFSFEPVFQPLLETLPNIPELAQFGTNALYFINGERGKTVISLPGLYTISFLPIAGYTTPPSQQINITQEDIDNANKRSNESGGSGLIIPIKATWTKAEPSTLRPTIYKFTHSFGKLEGPFVKLQRGDGYRRTSPNNFIFIGTGEYSVVLEPGQTARVFPGQVPGYITPFEVQIQAKDEGVGNEPAIREYEFRYIEDVGVVKPETCPPGTVKNAEGQCEPIQVLPIDPPTPDPGSRLVVDPLGTLIVSTEYSPILPGIGVDKLQEGRIYVNGEDKGSGGINIQLPPGQYIIRFGDLAYHPAIIYTTPPPIEVTVSNGSTARALGRYTGKYKETNKWLYPIAPDETATYHLQLTKGIFSNDIENLLTYHTSSISSTVDNHYTHIYQQDPDSPGAEIQFSLAYGHAEGSGSNDQGGQYNDTPTRAIYGQYRNIILGQANARFNLTGQETKHIYVISYQKERRDTRVDYNAFELNIAHLSGSEFLSGGGTLSTHTGSNVKLGGQGKVLRLITDTKINPDPVLGFGGYEYSVISGTIEDGPYNPQAVHRYGKLYPSLGVVLLDGDKLDLSASFATSTVREIDVKNQLKLFTALSGAAQYTDLTGNDYLGMKARATKEEIVNYYFINVRNKMANFTNNPSYFDPATGEIIGEGDTRPKTYITTIGLYDEQRQLLAIAKTSRPEKKSFTDEVVYNVRLKI